MCLSPQSARLRSDLHEKTKTCFRGIQPSSLSLVFFFPLRHRASSTRARAGAREARANTLCTRSANAAKGKAGSARLARGTLHFTMAKILCKASGSREGSCNFHPRTSPCLLIALDDGLIVCFFFESRTIDEFLQTHG